MAKKGRGKEFEQVIKQSFLKVPDTYVLRLPDQTSGYKGSRNPCDFIVYHRPRLFAVECKSTSLRSLPFERITQWEKLLAIADIDGVVAGIMCWWVNEDFTSFMPIKVLEKFRQETGKQSIRWIDARDLRGTLTVHGKKKKIYFDYDMDTFFYNFNLMEVDYGV